MYIVKPYNRYWQAFKLICKYPYYLIKSWYYKFKYRNIKDKSDEYWEVLDTVFWCWYKAKELVTCQPEDVVDDILAEAYAKSFPSLDYRHMESGHKKYSYKDYYLNPKIFDKIVDKHLKKHKKFNQYIVNQIRFSVFNWAPTSNPKDILDNNVIINKK